MILENTRFHWITNIELNTWTRVDVVEDQVTGKQFILKSVRKEELVYVHQFHKEVDTLSKIHYPYMPEIIDVFEQEEYYCLVETYIKGISLSSWIQKHPIRFHMRKYVLFYECLNCLEYLHSLQILYIDFKLDNILIEKGHVYLIDFNSCVPYQSTQVLLASSTNLATEYLNQDKKEYSSDIYGIGKAWQKWFSFGLFHLYIKRCVQKKASKRFQTIQQMKGFFLLIVVVRACLISILIVLSVYLVVMDRNSHSALQQYLNDQNIDLFMNAYTYTLNQQDGDTVEKIQSNLYLWIENDWFSSPLINSEYSTYLLRQALQSQNEAYCSYFVERMNDETLKKNKNLILLSNPSSISYEWIHMYLGEIEKHTMSYDDEIDSMNTLLSVLLNQQILLDANDRKMFFMLHDTYNQPCEKLENTVSKYLEYCLFLENRGISIPSIPPYYEKSFIENKQIQTLIQYIERS